MSGAPWFDFWRAVAPPSVPRSPVAHVLDWPRCPRHGRRCVELADGRLWCLDCDARPVFVEEALLEAACPTCGRYDR